MSIHTTVHPSGGGDVVVSFSMRPVTIIAGSRESVEFVLLSASPELSI